MSKYKGQHGGKTGSKNSGRGLPPPPFRAMPKRKHFFFREGFPNIEDWCRVSGQSTVVDDSVDHLQEPKKKEKWLKPKNKEKVIPP